MTSFFFAVQLLTDASLRPGTIATLQHTHKSRACPRAHATTHGTQASPAPFGQRPKRKSCSLAKTITQGNWLTSHTDAHLVDILVQAAPAEVGGVTDAELLAGSSEEPRPQRSTAAEGTDCTTQMSKIHKWRGLKSEPRIFMLSSK